MNSVFLGVLICLCSYSSSLEIVEDETCSVYKCNKDKDLADYTCAYYNNNTYYLQSCEEDKYCYIGAAGQNSTCLSEKPAEEYNKWPGEKCDNDKSCRYGKCVDGVCEGKLSPEPCTIHDECDAGLRCFANICKSQALEGSSCAEDYDCENNLACNNGICEEYFKHTEGEAVQNCVDGKTYSCEYVLCQDFRCLKKLKSERSITKPCTSDKDCKNEYYKDYPYEFTIYTDCQCGMNNNADSYCALFPGDEPMEDYLDLLKKWTQSQEIERCNTVRRFAKECVNDYWDSDNAAEYSYHQYRSSMWPQLQQNDKCVEEVYGVEYDELTKNYEEAEDDSAWMLGMVGCMLAWLI